MSAASTIWLLSRDGANDRYELTISLPLQTVSETNQREKWRERHRRRKEQRDTTGLVVASHLASEGIGVPCVVHLTRIAPSDGLDNDNLIGSMKAIRDGVADALEVDDSDERVMWGYAQRRGKAKEWGVEIRIRRPTATDTSAVVE